MGTLIANLIDSWIGLMGAAEAAGLWATWAPATLLAFGIALCLLGVKLFRPAFCLVTFFGVSGLLMFALRAILPWHGVVTTVAVLGIFAAFLALFMKRVAISCLATLGAAAIVFVGASAIAPGVPAVITAVIAGVLALVASLFRPKEALIVTTALFGAMLAGNSLQALAHAWLPPLAGLLDNVAIHIGMAGAIATGGAVLQFALSRKGLDPVFTQVIDLSKDDPDQVAPDGLAAESWQASTNSDESGHSADDARDAIGATAGADALGAAGAAMGVAGAVAAGAAIAGADSAAATNEKPANPIGRFFARQTESEFTFRKEIKYRIIEEDFLRIKNVVDAYLTHDVHSGWEGYPVRSLYFDSLDDRDLYDKLDGTLEHKKIRLRTYDPLGNKFNLEYKCRWSQDGIKRKLKLDRDQAMRLVRNDYSVLLEFDDPLARELYDRMVRGRYTPKVIVEYHRIAWEYPASNIRVTWDRGIRASYFAESFFEEHPLYIPVLPMNQGVLEVKYDHVFPSVLKDALRSIDQLPVANSKYALGRTYL